MTDPRTDHDFEPEHFPLCDGRPSVPGAPATDDGARMLEFLAAYYAINRLTARVAKARSAGGDAAAPLRELAGARAARDALEDRCAPVGFLAEPVLDGLMVTDVRFTTARKAARKPGIHRASFTLEIPPDSPRPALGADVPPLPSSWRS